MSEQFFNWSADVVSLAFLCYIKLLHDPIGDLAFVAVSSVEWINDEED